MVMETEYERLHLTTDEALHAGHAHSAGITACFIAPIGFSHTLSAMQTPRYRRSSPLRRFASLHGSGLSGATFLARWRVKIARPSGAIFGAD